MSTNLLKLTALICMFIDHIGEFIPHYLSDAWPYFLLKRQEPEKKDYWLHNSLSSFQNDRFCIVFKSLAASQKTDAAV